MTLHIPAGTEALYQAAPVWKDFKYNITSIEQVEVSPLKAHASNGILYISGLKTGKPLNIYSVSGQLVYTGIATAAEEQIPVAASGVYIVVSGEQTVKVIQ